MTGHPAPEAPVPPDRYGSRARRRPRRSLRWSLPVLALAVGIVAAVVGYANLGSPPIQGTAVAFRILDENSVRVTVEVRRDDPHRPAVCVLRSLGVSGKEAGRREVLVPPDDGTTYLRSVVTTSEPPATGEVFGCSYNVPEYLSTPTRPSG